MSKHHHVTFSKRGWFLEHPQECGAGIDECDLHAAIFDECVGDSEPPMPFGRYSVRFDAEDRLLYGQTK